MPVICREDFHEGICGLIAGRISSTVHKPVLIMTRNEDLYKGSGRSVPGFDLFAFLAPFPELCAFGGHEQAVGLSVRREDMPAFLKRVKEKMQEVSLAEISEETPAILISGNDITIDAVMESGHEPRRFAIDLLDRLRDLLIIRTVPDFERITIDWVLARFAR